MSRPSEGQLPLPLLFKQGDAANNGAIIPIGAITAAAPKIIKQQPYVIKGGRLGCLAMSTL